MFAVFSIMRHVLVFDDRRDWIKCDVPSNSTHGHQSAIAFVAVIYFLAPHRQLLQGEENSAHVATGQTVGPCAKSSSDFFEASGPEIAKESDRAKTYTVERGFIGFVFLLSVGVLVRGERWPSFEGGNWYGVARKATHY